MILMDNNRPKQLTKVIISSEIPMNPSGDALFLEGFLRGGICTNTKKKLDTGGAGYLSSPPPQNSTVHQISNTKYIYY